MTTSHLADAFARTVSAHPDRVALRCAEGDLTYRQLHESARSCARALAGTAGGEAGSPVSIEVSRSRASVVAILAAVLSGHSYVPIDAGYPDVRKDFLRQDCGARAHIDATGTEPSVRRVERQSGGSGAQAGEGSPHPDAAYVIYTSGSTGTPKGCVVTHRNVLSLFDATAAEFGPRPSDVCSVLHSLAFDFSVWELWTAWLSGAAAWLAPHDTVTDPVALVGGLARAGVSRLSATPALFGYLVAELARAEVALPRLRSVVLGGEAARLADVAAFTRSRAGKRVRVSNMYGITETTVHVTHRHLDGTESARRAGATPIGTPISSLTMSLRDLAGQEVAPGEVGEIWISGSGVCAGYLNRPELTRQRFVTDAAGLRWYRSGDLAFSDQGEYHYLGRADRQVQLRGYRVELGEVEAAMESLPGVAQAVACLERRAVTGQPVLVCYLRATPGGTAPAVPELIGQARRLLPPQAVPQLLRPVPNIPMTAHGKVDLEGLRRLASPTPG